MANTPQANNTASDNKRHAQVDAPPARDVSLRAAPNTDDAVDRLCAQACSQVATQVPVLGFQMVLKI